MLLRVGIDEAGYGPPLGPLVVAASIWRVPRTTPPADLWTALRGAVSARPAARDGRLTVADSKQVYRPGRGIAALERTVLAFAAAAGQPHGSLDELLAALGCAAAARAAQVPWYAAPGPPLPRDPARSAGRLAAARLRQAMADSGAQCTALAAELVPEPLFNRRVRQTRNKAALLAECVLRLIDRAARRAGPGTTLCVRVDRLGGRHDYRRLLARAFPDRALRVLACDAQRSAYRLDGPDGTWYVDFAVDADRHDLTVALASMTAKYVRELLMERFNAFWRGVCPQVAPTAGYARDARRFLREIHPALAQTGLRPAQFVRLR